MLDGKDAERNWHNAGWSGDVADLDGDGRDDLALISAQPGGQPDVYVLDAESEPFGEIVDVASARLRTDGSRATSRSRSTTSTSMDNPTSPSGRRASWSMVGFRREMGWIEIVRGPIAGNRVLDERWSVRIEGPDESALGWMLEAGDYDDNGVPDIATSHVTRDGDEAVSSTLHVITPGFLIDPL